MYSRCSEIYFTVTIQPLKPDNPRFKTASIYQRKNKDGSKVWRAVIRIKGHPSVSEHFSRKQEAEDWAQETELQIKKGKYTRNLAKDKTLSELIELYIQEAVIGYHKAAADTVRQLNYFRERLGNYALIYLTPELLLRERKTLIDKPSNRNKPLNPATVNRYFATLSGAFEYACKHLPQCQHQACKPTS